MLARISSLLISFHRVLSLLPPRRIFYFITFSRLPSDFEASFGRFSTAGVIFPFPRVVELTLDSVEITRTYVAKSYKPVAGIFCKKKTDRYEVDEK